MAQRAHIPKFGNWESAGSAPYTQYFNNARKGKAGKLINPNDPEENPEAFPEEALPIQVSPVRSGSDPEAFKSTHERRPSREESVQRQPFVPPLIPERRARKSSVGSDRSIELSPLHPQYHAKSASRGAVSSPSWERKGSSEGLGHGSNIPGRSRMRPGGRGNDIYEKGQTVPKFGAWDENDPASAEGFTHIFSEIRKEKHIGSKVPVVMNESSYSNSRNRSRNSESVSCWCFSLGKN